MRLVWRLDFSSQWAAGVGRREFGCSGVVVLGMSE